MRRLAALCLTAMLSLAAPHAVQADDLIKSVSMARLADMLKDAGYRAEVVEGKPSFVRTGAGGYNVVVFFYDCAKDECAAIRYYVGFRQHPKFTTAFADRFNSERRYVKAYLAKNGGLNFVYDIDLRAGVSPAVIKQSIQQFEVLLARFDEFLRNAPAAPEAAPGGDIAAKARDAETLVAEGKFIEAVGALDEASTKLWDASPLTFRRALWVATTPDGFGAYNPRENNVYASGAPMIAYAEPVGFGWKQSGDVYQTDLGIDIVVKDKDGAELLRRADFQGLKLGSRVRNHEFMMHYTFTFTGIPTGDYVLDVITRDKVSGKSGAFSLPFLVR